MGNLVENGREGLTHNGVRGANIMHVGLEGLNIVSRVLSKVILVNRWRFEFSIVRVFHNFVCKEGINYNIYWVQQAPFPYATPNLLLYNLFSQFSSSGFNLSEL